MNVRITALFSEQGGLTLFLLRKMAISAHHVDVVDIAVSHCLVQTIAAEP